MLSILGSERPCTTVDEAVGVMPGEGTTTGVVGVSSKAAGGAEVVCAPWVGSTVAGGVERVCDVVPPVAGVDCPTRSTGCEAQPYNARSTAAQINNIRLVKRDITILQFGAINSPR